jgi:hypothetical protein
MIRGFLRCSRLTRNTELPDALQVGFVLAGRVDAQDGHVNEFGGLPAGCDRVAFFIVTLKLSLNPSSAY